MDKAILIKNLNSVFCEINRAEKKYSEVWLSDVDFGELYHANKYILNVKAEHEIESCNDEILDILKILDAQAHDELQSIWSVFVYNSNDDLHCISDELLIFEKGKTCK